MSPKKDISLPAMMALSANSTLLAMIRYNTHSGEEYAPRGDALLAPHDEAEGDEKNRRSEYLWYVLSSASFLMGCVASQHFLIEPYTPLCSKGDMFQNQTFSAPHSFRWNTRAKQRRDDKRKALRAGRRTA